MEGNSAHLFLAFSALCECERKCNVFAPVSPFVI